MVSMGPQSLCHKVRVIPGLQSAPPTLLTAWLQYHFKSIGSRTYYNYRAKQQHKGHVPSTLIIILSPSVHWPPEYSVPIARLSREPSEEPDRQTDRQTESSIHEGLVPPTWFISAELALQVCKRKCTHA